MKTLLSNYWIITPRVPKKKKKKKATNSNTTKSTTPQVHNYQIQPKEFSKNYIIPTSFSFYWLTLMPYDFFLSKRRRRDNWSAFNIWLIINHFQSTLKLSTITSRLDMIKDPKHITEKFPSKKFRKELIIINCFFKLMAS